MHIFANKSLFIPWFITLSKICLLRACIWTIRRNVSATAWWSGSWWWIGAVATTAEKLYLFTKSYEFTFQHIAYNSYSSSPEPFSEWPGNILLKFPVMGISGSRIKKEQTVKVRGNCMRKVNFRHSDKVSMNLHPALSTLPPEGLIVTAIF